MQYNFDEIISRENTRALKLERRQMLFGTKDVIPMWVADMDFKSPDFIINALKERLSHEILGYSVIPDSTRRAVEKWFRRRHKWSFNRESITFTPGVVPALNMAIKTFSSPGDKIIVQPPVYFPFFSAVKDNNRQLVYNPLKLINDRYYFDLEDLKQKIDEKVKIIVLCNPHNPGGMVWTKDELQELGNICIENNILILSDEIHCDLVYSGYTYTPMANISPEISAQTITFSAPSKTFNIAGLAASFAVSSNEELTQRYRNALDTFHMSQTNLLGALALEFAYTQGEEWLKELMDYLDFNRQYMKNYLHVQIPFARLMMPESTFLAWIDFSKLGMSNKELRRFLVKDAGLGLSEGFIFGPGGEGFCRLNFGAPHKVVKEALFSLKDAMDKYNLQFYL